MRVLFILSVLATLGSQAPVTVTAASPVYIFGGPGSLEGRFETATGALDEQSWLGIECPEAGVQYLWQQSDFRADNLNSHGSGNHAMWAGQTAEQRPTWKDPPGYGDAWNTVVQWVHPAPTTTSSFDVQLEAVYNHDTEEFYDLVHVEWNQAGTWQALEEFDGNSADGSGNFLPPGETMFHQWTVQPEDLVDGELHIRLRVTSDPIVSDQSGDIGSQVGDSNGAIQIDDITVSFDGVPVDGGGDPDGVATFENGDDEGWTPQPDTCSCSIVSALTADVDPGPDNLTPQIGFFRSTAYPGTQAPLCYFHSPAIVWDVPAAQGLDATRIRFRSYRESNGNLDRWILHARSRVAGQWQPYQAAASVTAAAPGWQSFDFDITPYVAVDAEEIQFQFISIAVDASELRMTFDDIEVLRFDGTLTDAPPRTPAGRIELEVFPNPTNPASTVRYVLDVGGPIRIGLFDARGRKVRTLFEGPRPAGTHTLEFDGLDDGGRSLASGVYFVRLQVDGQVYGDRVVLVR